MMVDLFISYRRTQAFVAERIHERLCDTFRGERVFLDRSEIRPGAEFPKVIREALDSAKIVLALIDSTWISVQDERTYQRRLDTAGDWVRQEIEAGLRSGKTIIPVLLDGAAMPTNDQLPASIAGLAARNHIRVARESFADDVDRLIGEIKARISAQELQELLEDASNPYPKAAEFKPVPIEGELLETMMSHLPAWSLVESAIVDDPRLEAASTRKEIVRNFRFPSFLAAIDFMKAPAGRIDAFGHHPRWENIFKTVRVALSTWDIGHQPSDRDFKTAIMLEKLYEASIKGD